MSSASCREPTRRRLRLRALLHLFLPSLSALLLASAFPPLEWSLMAWIALIPLCFVMVDQYAFIETYLGAYLGGMAFQMLTLDWLRTTYGGRALSGDNALNWLLISVVLGLMWPIVISIGRVLARTRSPMFLILPLLWTSYEFARKYLWALLVDQTGNPWSQIGYTQASHLYVVQIADLGGVYAVTFLIAAVNGALWDLFRLNFTARRPRVHLSERVFKLNGTSPPVQFAGIASARIPGECAYDKGLASAPRPGILHLKTVSQQSQLCC